MWTQTNSSLYGIMSVRSNNNNKNEEKNIQHNEIFLVFECGCTCLDIKTFKYMIQVCVCVYEKVFNETYFCRFDRMPFSYFSSQTCEVKYYLHISEEE